MANQHPKYSITLGSLAAGNSLTERQLTTRLERSYQPENYTGIPAVKSNPMLCENSPLNRFLVYDHQPSERPKLATQNQTHTSQALS